MKYDLAKLMKERLKINKDIFIFKKAHPNHPVSDDYHPKEDPQGRDASDGGWAASDLYDNLQEKLDKRENVHSEYYGIRIEKVFYEPSNSYINLIKNSDLKGLLRSFAPYICFYEIKCNFYIAYLGDYIFPGSGRDFIDNKTLQYSFV